MIRFCITTGLLCTTLTGTALRAAAPQATPTSEPTPAPLVFNHSGTSETVVDTILRKGGVVNAADYPTLQAAVDALPLYGGMVFMPPGVYKLDKPLNLSNTYNSKDKTRWITLQGSGKMNTTIIGDFPDSVIVDMTRCGMATLRDFTIAGRARCMLLLARDKETRGGGGGNYFENIMVRGDNCEVAVMCRSGEVNRFVNCSIYVSKPNATAFWFTHLDPLGLKSPYLGETGESSTTELRFFGTSIDAHGENSIGLRVDGNAADVSIIGGYFSNFGFASIYLDGTQGNVGEVQIHDLRIEGETGIYNLYAKGSVNRVSIHGGAWVSAGECIRYEDVGEAQFWPAAAATGWSITNLGAYIGDYTLTDSRGPNSGRHYFDGPGGRAVIRLDKMRECHIQNVLGGGHRMVKKGDSTNKPAPKTQAEKEAVVTFGMKADEVEFKSFKPKLLVCEKEASANTIMVQERGDVVFLGQDQGNQITALNDNGVRRTYFGGGTRPEVPNFPVLEATAIANPQAGDFALLKEADGTAAPAYYDGKQWQFLARKPVAPTAP